MFIMSMEHFSERYVAYIPENGFPGRNNSTLALKYLRWLEHKDPSLHIQHSLKGNEFKIGPYFVDGYVAATNTVLEVYGCLWHGCPRCYHNRDMKCPRRKDFTMQKLFDETMARESIIKHMGFNIQTAWECDLSEQLEREPEMAQYFKRVSLLKMFFLHLFFFSAEILFNCCLEKECMVVELSLSRLLSLLMKITLFNIEIFALSTHTLI